MPRGLFVTGTDTNVGKTVVSAALLHRYRGEVAVRYWKPVQTGIEQDDDTATVARLGACAAHEILADGVRLARPVSPHLAARWSGVSITLPPLRAICDRAVTDAALIVEGAGGVLVPLNDRETMVDLMAALALPAVVVARTTLGTINHTLLTVDALRRRSMEVAGVVLVGTRNDDVRQAVEHHGDVCVVGEMPHFERLDAEVLGGWAASLDADRHLLRWLR